MKPQGFYRLIGNKEPKKWILDREELHRSGRCKITNRYIKRSGRNNIKIFIKKELEEL